MLNLLLPILLVLNCKIVSIYGISGRHVYIFDYADNNSRFSSQLETMLILVGFEEPLIHLHNDSLCAIADTVHPYDFSISILLSPLLCQSYPEHYIIWHVGEDLYELTHRYINEDPFVSSRHILEYPSVERVQLGIPVPVLMQASMIWESKYEYLSTWDSFIGKDAAETLLLVPFIDSSNHEQLNRLLEALQRSLGHIFSSIAAHEESRKIRQGRNVAEGFIYPCRHPACTYSCLGSFLSPQVGWKHRDKIKQQQQSTWTCEQSSSTLCADISRSVNPDFTEWIPPPPLVCPSGPIVTPDVLTSSGYYTSSEAFDLYPIGFVSPPDDIVKCIPEKVRYFSAIDPADRSTYIYRQQDEIEYKRNMAHSRFSYTRKKAGYDAQRHFEIMAAGTVPYFEGIDDVPSKIIPFMPRELLVAAKRFADLSATDYDALGRPTHFKPGFNHTAYNELACCLRQHAESHQTSVSLVKYIINIVNKPLIRSILVLCELPNFDYIVPALIDGFRRIYGDDAVLDFPFNSVYYSILPEETAYETMKAKYVHGLGYTWSHRLRNSTMLNRGDIKRGIEAKRWDLIVYPQVHRGMPFWSSVKKHYSRDSIVLVDAEDWLSSQFLLVEWLHHEGELTEVEGRKRPIIWPPLNEDWRALFHQGMYFKRELDACPDASGAYFKKFERELAAT